MKFFYALLFSLALMIVDYHYHYLNHVRRGISVFVSPMQYAVDYPVRVIGWMRSLVGSKKELIAENIQLQLQHTILEARLQKYHAVLQENSMLKQLLKAGNSGEQRTMAAQILAVETNPFRQLLVLNKGSRNGVFVGQPVLDAKGVMGQIISVGSMTSTLLLVSDSKSAVPVQNNRTGERAILVGTNSLRNLSLINLPKTSAISKGDLLVTSGLGRRYPEGYPVGRVESVENVPGEEFITVKVAPEALLNRDRLVLIIWPDKNHLELSAQINQRLGAFEELKQNA